MESKAIPSEFVDVVLQVFIVVVVEAVVVVAVVVDVKVEVDIVVVTVVVVVDCFLQPSEKWTGNWQTENKWRVKTNDLPNNIHDKTNSERIVTFILLSQYR